MYYMVDLYSPWDYKDTLKMHFLVPCAFVRGSKPPKVQFQLEGEGREEEGRRGRERGKERKKRERRKRRREKEVQRWRMGEERAQ
jgi:hypothetical protein